MKCVWGVLGFALALFQCAAEDQSLLLGARSCSASACHGGVGTESGQYSIWVQKDLHSKSHATLFNTRSRRIADSLKVSEPSRDQSCTVCHAPFHTVPQVRLAEGAWISESVSCETCHKPAESWIRSHTRADLSYAQKLSSGLRDLRHPYVRANVCVACHFLGGGPLVEAGHPLLDPDLPELVRSMPPHWKEPDTPRPAIQDWVLAQVVVVREWIHSLAQSDPPLDRVPPKLEAKLTLLRLAAPSGLKIDAEVERALANPESVAGRLAVFRFADETARRLAENEWDSELQKQWLTKLFAWGTEGRAAADAAPLNEHHARLIVRGLKTLFTDAAIRPPFISSALDELETMTAYPAQFDAERFQEALVELRRRLKS